MKDRRISRPSPALVVAIAALIMATTGTAMAAGHLVNGDKLIKPHTLSGNRLRAHTITRKQINVKRLGTVPKAKKAATLPPLVWHLFELENGWKDFYAPADSKPAAFAVDAQRIVHLRGVIHCPTSDCAARFATVPASFALAHRSIYLAADTVDRSTGRIQIDPPGAMSAVDPGDNGNSLILTSLDGVTYPLE